MNPLNTLTLIYTANLRGELALLPRLYTFIKHVRQEQSLQNVVLVDLGGACSADVWHCEVTGGRSMLIGLDGMGYAAVNAQALAQVERDRLYQQCTVALLADDQTHVVDHWLFATTSARGDGHLCVVLAPAPETSLDEQMLSLAEITGGQIGIVQIAVTNNRYSLLSTQIATMPPDVLPDATIAGLVEFIESEARYRQRRDTPPTDNTPPNG